MINLREWAVQLRKHALLVYFSARDKRTPGYVRVIALLVAAYTFSPIDLIPDFIPIIGYLDDLILIPLGVALVMHLTPEEVTISASKQAEAAITKPISYSAAVIIIGIWLILGYLLLEYVLIAIRT